MTEQAIFCDWDGEALRPIGRTWASRADAQWVVGEKYYVETRQERSEASHRAYFASINEAFQNLPEHLAQQFPSADHLRRFALIKSGYADQRSIAVATAAEAQQLAAFMKPLDGYAIITASENVVTVFTAKSQSYKAMGREEFQRSKSAVLEIVAAMIGSTADTLQRNAGQAA